MLQVEAYSAIGGRSKNEDNITGWHKGDNMCFLVADGLGGHGDGDLASKEAINVIRTVWDGEISPAAWEHLLELSHKRIRQIQTSRAQMKTTIVGLMMNTERAVWAHVGDSRLYHFLNGHLVFQTQDHSASQIAVMLGEITPAQIRSSKDRATLIKALGQEGPTPMAQIHEQALEPGMHAFLLCTDGFWEYVLEDEMEQDLQESHTAKQWLEKMRCRLQSRASLENDNNSAIVVWKMTEEKRNTE
jgi:hypothetical protein